ncbi:hypothetical protein PybrP1_002961 [[Pythium] brassicae (nom. inval.)]|nr:hypothetical protein PybrP1_002961 [[Pythium] brassicae (nom. inval.)]
MTPRQSFSDEAKPVGPPAPPFQSTLSRVLLLLVTPFLLLALGLWWLLGRVFTLSGRVVAALTVATGFALFLSIPHTPLRLLDWPLVLTAAAAVCALAQKRAAPQLAVWLALIVYGILRTSLLDESGTTARLANALCAACVLFPGWMLVCNLRLWLPADGQTLEEIEEKIYHKYVVTEFKMHKIAGLGTVHVPYCGDSTQLPARNLVLVHGYMAGNAFWAANLQALAKFFNVYAVEWRGIGRSVRPAFQRMTDRESDEFFVESLEEWRRELQLNRFILCAHSMGAIYSTYYSEKYSQHIEHMILVSPAGVNSSGVTDAELGGVWKFIARHALTPMSAVRFAGPLGLKLVQWIMRRRVAWTPPSNIIRSGDMDFEHITQYCYHNWALEKSGEIALHTHLHPGASARQRPLSELLTPAAIKVPLTIMYGGGSDWMNADHGEAVVRSLEKTHYAAFRLVPLAGHQVFMDNPADFNRMVIEAVHEHERSTL